MDKNTVLSLLNETKKAEAEGSGKLPRNSFYLDYDKVVCCEREIGESRYPYDTDGLVVWLRSTGFIDSLESTFQIFKTANFGEESAVSFFGGIKNGEGDYTPVSVTGASRQAIEPGVKRYIVYSVKHAWCITEADGLVFALRLFVDSKKHIHFTLMGINNTDETKEFYLASFMEAMLRYNEFEKFWDRLTKYGTITDNGTTVLKSRNGATTDCVVINKKVTDGNCTKVSSTAARGDFLGVKGLSVATSRSLRRGYFAKEAKNVATTDLPCAADIFHMVTEAGETARVDYDLYVCHSEEEAMANTTLDICADCIDADLEMIETAEKSAFDNIKVRFENWKSGKVDADTFNKFFRTVQKQTSVCAHGKNYAGAYLGIRDVFQQLEGALIWQPELSREKILNALNCILVTGRPPRMFSVPDDPKAPVPVSLEKYIDQGVWVISTVYTYLAYTNDWSILDEVCGYIEAGEDEIWTSAKRSEERDTVLCHLLRIMGYLFSKIDTEYGTGCVRVLFGDWNDALDGLGDTEDEGEEFGSGVTVMATLQFYQNLREMTEILTKVGGYDAEIAKYKAAAAALEKGLEEHAIVTNEAGERKIIHGWGDKIGYKVGSWSDPDGASRYSLTSNSFWAITKFLRRDPSLKSSIMACMNAVSSMYGLKTFDVAFPRDCKGVGRIAAIVPGTYENSCAYAHGSLFGTMALFEMGESERAWREIEKTAVITHDNCTMSSFVMPNSYCENADYGMDGESMGDWHTGSGAVLVKETIRYGFGIHPSIDGVRIQPPAYFPAERAEITLNVKGASLTLTYEDKKNGTRNVVIEGADGYTEEFDSLMNTTCYYIPAEKLTDKVTVKITD
ncbi:MAG: hypothetical protein IKL24_02295 [Clostridia bacterium]|nr:hypothetical protein [Clostridia bacterium]